MADCLTAAEGDPSVFLRWCGDLRRLCLLTSIHYWALFPDLCTRPSVGCRPRSLHYCCVRDL